MMVAHVHPCHADWAAVMDISFPVPMNLEQPVSQAIQSISDTLRTSQFRFQELGVWKNRMEKLVVAAVGGCVLAALLLMGSISGTWVTLVAAAGADLSPILGHNPAVWGFPFSRRIRMESRSNVSQGAKTSLKRISHFASVQQAVCENAILQSITGVLSIPMSGATLVSYYVNGGISIGFGPANISYMDWGVLSLNFCSAITILVCAMKYSPSEMLHGKLLMVLAMLDLGSKSLWSQAGFMAATNATWMSYVWIWLASHFISCWLVFRRQKQATSFFCCWLWACVWGTEFLNSVLMVSIAFCRLVMSKGLAPKL